MKKKDWHLRISLTDECNFRCLYCNPDGLKSKKKTLTGEYIKQILHAAKANSISRVHWTGGEPTIFKDKDDDIVSLIRYASGLGYVDQVMTTNGSTFYRMIDDVVSAGLNRVNISIDSLNEERNRFLTKRDMLRQTKQSLEASVRKFSQVTKMNVVAMKDTIPELPEFVKYATSLMSMPNAIGKVAIKLIEICPNNPAQLQDSGEKFYLQQHIGREELIDAVKKIGRIKSIGKEELEGDNPNAQYYLLGDTGVTIGFVTMPSTGWPCGRDYCRKFRITPYGGAAVCLNLPIVNLINNSDEEISKMIKKMMREREDLDNSNPRRIHYRPMLGEMRFGDCDGILKPKTAEYFTEACARNR